jgi:uncharacterized protein YqhQ
VIEGVMMRGQKAYAVAMRAPDGKIAIHTEGLASVYRSKITKIPFLRGVILLWDALGLGMKALTLSANTQTGEDEKLEGPALYLTVGLSLTIGIGLFFLVRRAKDGRASARFHFSAPGLAPVESTLRLLLLIGYIWAIDSCRCKTLFGNSREHKTINAYEAAELTRIRRQISHRTCAVGQRFCSRLCWCPFWCSPLGPAHPVETAQSHPAHPRAGRASRSNTSVGRRTT